MKCSKNCDILGGMPAHISHNLFAFQAVDNISSLVENHKKSLESSCLALGAQGPDIFFHNQRTKPSGLAYGIKLHGSGYGKCCSALSDWILQEGLQDKQQEVFYLYGFVTHAVLDRYTHPFIISRAGSETAGAHAFYERIIDVLMLRRSLNIDPNTYDFLSRLPSGYAVPECIIDMLNHSLSFIYPRSRLKRQAKNRIENAFNDSLTYYTHTNYIDQEYICRAMEREKTGDIKEKWLSIIHPMWFPDEYDYLNLEKKIWHNPWTGIETNDSFVDLWEKGLDRAVMLLEICRDVLQGDKPSKELETGVGNGPLGGQVEHNAEQKHESPLPFKEIFKKTKEWIREKCLY